MYVMIVPEPHLWDRSIKTIPRYAEVQKGIMLQVQKIALDLAGQDSLCILHMGDLFHKGITDYDAGMDWYDYFCSLDDLTRQKQYTVLGNHELTYSNKNPFWRFVDIKSQFVSKLGRFKIYDDAIRHPIKLVDTLRLGKTEIVFWHFGMDISKYTTDAENVIILAHQELIDKEIDYILKKKYDRDQLTDIIDYRSLRDYRVLPKLPQIRYLFVGHMHTAYSRFHVEENINGINYNFELQYLGSLGRTKAIEVRSDDLERTIPVFKFDENGNFYACDRKLTLPGEEIVSSEQVRINREKYNRNIEVRELKRSVQIITSPMETLKNVMSQKSEIQELVEPLIAHTPLPEYKQIMTDLTKPLPRLLGDDLVAMYDKIYNTGNNS